RRYYSESSLVAGVRVPAGIAGDLPGVAFLDEAKEHALEIADRFRGNVAGLAGGGRDLDERFARRLLFEQRADQVRAELLDHRGTRLRARAHLDAVAHEITPFEPLGLRLLEQRLERLLVVRGRRGRADHALMLGIG